jgi:hypothetical protein
MNYVDFAKTAMDIDVNLEDEEVESYVLGTMDFNGGDTGVATESQKAC